MNFRIDRLNSEMRKEIALIIDRKIKDPRVTSMVGVNAVEVAKDLKTAKVYVSLYGDKEKAEETLSALRSAANFIRKELAAIFKEIRTVPALDFRLDTSFEYGAKIESILEEINKSDAH